MLQGRILVAAHSTKALRTQGKARNSAAVIKITSIVYPMMSSSCAEWRTDTWYLFVYEKCMAHATPHCVNPDIPTRSADASALGTVLNQASSYLALQSHGRHVSTRIVGAEEPFTHRGTGEARAVNHSDFARCALIHTYLYSSITAYLFGWDANSCSCLKYRNRLQFQQGPSHCDDEYFTAG